MELYLDTSDVAAVKKLARVFPLAGVTTNPSIVAAGKTPFTAQRRVCCRRWRGLNMSRLTLTASMRRGEMVFRRCVNYRIC